MSNAPNEQHISSDKEEGSDFESPNEAGEGAFLGMSEEGTTFEPEEDPEGAAGNG